MGSSECPSVADLPFVTPFPCLQNEIDVIVFAEEINWWEDPDYSLGEEVFAHMLNKPFHPLNL